MSLSRRDLLILGSAALAAKPDRAWGAARWATRNPAEWTPEDIDAVLNRSPWVREVLLAMPDPGPAGGAIAPSTIPSEYKAVVRWESGLPIRLARHTSARPGGDTGYVLSVSRLPLDFALVLSGADASHRKGRETLNTPEWAVRIAKASFLQREGHPPMPAARAEWFDADLTSRLMIYFDPGAQPISLADREVSLVSAVGPMTFAARFLLKQMVYRGKLEI